MPFSDELTRIQCQSLNCIVGFAAQSCGPVLHSASIWSEIGKIKCSLQTSTVWILLIFNFFKCCTEGRGGCIFLLTEKIAKIYNGNVWWWYFCRSVTRLAGGRVSSLFFCYFAIFPVVDHFHSEGTSTFRLLLNSVWIMNFALMLSSRKHTAHQILSLCVFKCNFMKIYAQNRAHLSSTNGVYPAINLNCVFIFILSVAFHISPFRRSPLWQRQPQAHPIFFTLDSHTKFPSFPHHTEGENERDTQSTKNVWLNFRLFLFYDLHAILWEKCSQRLILNVNPNYLSIK